ncbi:WD repeat-containing protein wdr-5.1 [Hondaea fermentalgiana]|uniref:WD repeat-containing protein wdr-5.1 n=1 Tax=Hondaea fermentalgiana TaxID=2315210 RepID=A0A2R5GER8_9STRA|nr:WD repeat-containing protein wdr-5.1 [Hondaea fermentalgiana]|eukprot:GBG29427.1 WD repeat-containing protein wdr-5.1 [Hondaea fermentalgiana]
MMNHHPYPPHSVPHQPHHQPQQVPSHHSPGVYEGFGEGLQQNLHPQHHPHQENIEHVNLHPHKRQRVRSRGGSMDFLFDFDDGAPVSDFLGAVPADPISATLFNENDDTRGSEHGLRWDDNQSMLSGPGSESFTLTTPDHLIRMSQRWERMARRGELCDLEFVIAADNNTSEAPIPPHGSSAASASSSSGQSSTSPTMGPSFAHAAAGLPAPPPHPVSGETSRQLIVPLHAVFACACSSVIADLLKDAPFSRAAQHDNLHEASQVKSQNNTTTSSDNNNNNNVANGNNSNAKKKSPGSNGANSTRKNSKNQDSTSNKNGSAASLAHAHSPSNSISGDTEAYESSTCSSKGSAVSALGAKTRTATNTGSTKSLLLADATRRAAPFSSYLRVSTRMHLGQPRISLEIHGARVGEEAAVAVRTYMYTGIVNFRPEVMAQILQLALILDIKPLIELASGYLMSNLSTTYVFETLHIASQFHVPNLKEAACEYIMRHFDTCTQLPGWAALPKDSLRAILIGDEIHTMSEIMVFRALVNWTLAAEEQRKNNFLNMALDGDVLRLSNMSRDELFEISNHKLISESKELRRALYNEAMERIQTTGVAPPSGAPAPSSAKRSVSKPRRYTPNTSLTVPSPVEEAENLAPLVVNKCEHTLSGFVHPVCALAFVGGYLAAASSDSIFIYRIRDWELVTTLRGHESTVVSLRAFQDRLISASPDRTIRVWSTDTWECLNVVSTSKSSVCTMIVHEDKLITGSDDGALKSWSLSSWNLLRNVSAHQHVIWALATYGKDTLITGSSDTTIKVWSICRKGGFQAVCTLDCHKDEVQALTVDHSRGWLLSGSDDGCINIHDCKTWTQLRSISWHGRAVLSLVSYGNRVIAGLGNGVVGIWDKDEILQSEKCLTELVEHKSCVMALQAVQGRLVTASYDRTIRIWGP